MKLDHSDATPLTAIALGSLVGLVGTGAFLASVEDARDRGADVRVERVIEPHVRIRTRSEISPNGRSIRLLGPEPFASLRPGPDVYIDGVRIDADLLALENLDVDHVESVEVRKSPDRPGRGEVRIRLRQR